MSGEESLQESDLAALGAGILIEQDTLIRTMKGSGKKLRKNRKRADQMLALRSIIPEVASRCETREEVSERELEETHRTLTASALKELERQAAEEFLQQGSQDSLSQPTPEKEANLEEYMMTHSKVDSFLMGEGVEGLMSEVQREREKYPSLLEENRLLEETQMRMTELAISPGPPPPPNTHHAVFTCYPTPTLPSVPFYQSTDVPIAHPFPVYSHSLPPALSPLPYHIPTTFRSPSNQLPNIPCTSFCRKRKRCSTEDLEENLKIAQRGKNTLPPESQTEETPNKKRKFERENSFAKPASPVKLSRDEATVNVTETKQKRSKTTKREQRRKLETLKHVNHTLMRRIVTILGLLYLF